MSLRLERGVCLFVYHCLIWCYERLWALWAVNRMSEVSAISIPTFRPLTVTSHWNRTSLYHRMNCNFLFVWFRDHSEKNWLLSALVWGIRLSRGRIPRLTSDTFKCCHKDNCHKDTERGNCDFCLSRSHYTNTDSASKERAPGAGIEPTTCWPEVAHYRLRYLVVANDSNFHWDWFIGQCLFSNPISLTMLDTP